MTGLKKVKCILAAVLTILIVSTLPLAGCTPKPAGNPPTDKPSSTLLPPPGKEDDSVTEEEKERLSVFTITNDTTVFNIFDFGAVSGKDCTEAIRQGVEYLQENGGGILYFPAGKYTVSSQIKFKSGVKAPVILMGDNDEKAESVIIMATRMDGPAFDVASDNVGFAYLRLQNKMKRSSSLYITGGKTTVYKCLFDSYVSGYKDPFITVCGQDALLSNLSFINANADGNTVNFTKVSGIESKNNKLIDTYIGGSINSILIDSKDETGCPEDVLISGATLLNYYGGQIDIKSVKNCTIANSMLDQGYEYCIRLDPQGAGIDGVNISTNYIAAAYDHLNVSFDRHAITIPAGTSSAPVKNVSIVNNLIDYGRYGINVQNENASNLFISGNFVGGNLGSLNLKQSKDNTIVSNNFSTEFFIGEFLGKNKISYNSIYIMSKSCNFSEYRKENYIFEEDAK